MSKNRPPGHAHRGVRLCEHCGGRHYTRGERSKCENDHTPTKPPPAVRKGTGVTRYANDPLKGNKRAHAISRKLRDGWTPRKTAKYFGISLDDVKDVQEKLR